HLSAEIVRALFARETVYEYDMGPGDNDYKSRWARGAHELGRLRIFRPGMYGTLLHTVEARMLERVRRLRGQGAAAGASSAAWSTAIRRGRWSQRSGMRSFPAAWPPRVSAGSTSKAACWRGSEAQS